MGYSLEWGDDYYRCFTKPKISNNSWGGAGKPVGATVPFSSGIYPISDLSDLFAGYYCFGCFIPHLSDLDSRSNLFSVSFVFDGLPREFAKDYYPNDPGGPVYEVDLDLDALLKFDFKNSLPKSIKGFSPQFHGTYGLFSESYFTLQSKSVYVSTSLKSTSDLYRSIPSLFGHTPPVPKLRGIETHLINTGGYAPMARNTEFLTTVHYGYNVKNRKLFI